MSPAGVSCANIQQAGGTEREVGENEAVDAIEIGPAGGDQAVKVWGHDIIRSDGIERYRWCGGV